MNESDKFLQERYNLKSKIFKDKSNLRFEFWVDRINELARWKDIVEEAVENNLNTLHFIIGDYGMGKTFSLNKIGYEFKDRNDVFQTYLNLVSETKFHGGIDFIFRLFKSLDFGKLVENKPKKLVKKALKDIPNTTNLNISKNILTSIYFPYDTRNASLFDDDEGRVEVSSDNLGVRLLQGDTLTSAERDILGIDIKKIDNLDDAKLHLSVFLIFARNLDFKVFLILVDEFEYLFSLLSNNEQQKYLALFRGLHDLSDDVKIPQEEMSNLVFFFATSSDGWSKFTSTEETTRGERPGPLSALRRRINEPTILEPFDLENTYSLIKARLSYDRVRNVHLETPMIPFTDDFVKFLFKITEGRPSLILTLSAHVMDEGLAKKIEVLDAKFAKSVFEDRGFYYDEGD